MGEAAGPVAAIFSLAGGVMSGMGAAAGNKQAAQAAVRAAQVGKIQADDTDTAMREELQSTLGDIQAIRASAGVGDSPTGNAIIDKERSVSTRQRTIKVANIRAQVASDENAARFYKSSARTALFGGILGGLTSAAGMLASSAGSASS